MRNIYTSDFDYKWNLLAGYIDRAARKRNQKERLARVRLAQKFQSYFPQALGTALTGAVGEIVTGQTKPLTFPALLLDAWFTGSTLNEVSIMRTNPSRTQISIVTPMDNHFASRRFMQARWLEPMDLAVNELLQCRTTLRFAITAGTQIAVSFRVIGLNKKPCPDAHWLEIEDYICATPEQYPVYLPCYSPNGRTIEFAHLGSAQRANIVTREVDQPCLITGVGYSGTGLSSSTVAVKTKIASSTGHSFTPDPIVFPGSFQFTEYSEAGPGGGLFRYFEFPMPHYLPRGGTMSMALSDATITAESMDRAEIVFRGVTI